MRISGSCSGSRAKVAALYAVCGVRLASTAILTLPGKTPTSSAALASPAAGRVAGCSSPAAQASSATPEPRMTSRWAGTQRGISGLKVCGRTRWVTPETVKMPASRATSRGSEGEDIWAR